MQLLLSSILFFFLTGIVFCQKPVLVKFKSTDIGEKKSLEEWGLDATWVNHYNAAPSKRNAGELIDFIRIGFYMHEPYNEDGSLSKRQIKDLDDALSFVHKVNPKMPIKLSPHNMSRISDWYKEKDGSANVERWVHVMEKTKEYVEGMGHTIHSLEVFNEPDWEKWNMGKTEDFRKILKKTKSWGVPRTGPSTLSTTPALKWYEPIKRELEYGGTHTLGGTMEQYFDFIKEVKRDRKKFMNPEVHSLVEVIVGIEEGLDAVCWWDQIHHERAAFMKACLGHRLAYKAVKDNWSAACVYRDPEGLIHGFASTNERNNGKETVYHFICEDKDMTYYINGERDKGVFCKKGTPFKIQAKIKQDDHTAEKKTMTHWFTIEPSKE